MWNITEFTNSSHMNSSRSDDDFSYYSLFVVLFVLLPLAVVDIVVLVVIVREKTTPGFIRLILANNIVSSEIVIAGLVQIFFSNVILSVVKDKSPHFACRLALVTISSGGAGRFLFMSAFAVAVFCLVKSGTVQIKNETHHYSQCCLVDVFHSTKHISILFQSNRDHFYQWYSVLVLWSTTPVIHLLLWVHFILWTVQHCSKCCISYSNISVHQNQHYFWWCGNQAWIDKMCCFSLFGEHSEFFWSFHSFAHCNRSSKAWRFHQWCPHERSRDPRHIISHPSTHFYHCLLQEHSQGNYQLLLFCTCLATVSCQSQFKSMMQPSNLLLAVYNFQQYCVLQ